MCVPDAAGWNARAWKSATSAAGSQIRSPCPALTSVTVSRLPPAPKSKTSARPAGQDVAAAVVSGPARNVQQGIPRARFSTVTACIPHTETSA